MVIDSLVQFEDYCSSVDPILHSSARDFLGTTYIVAPVGNHPSPTTDRYFTCSSPYLVNYISIRSYIINDVHMPFVDCYSGHLKNLQATRMYHRQPKLTGGQRLHGSVRT